MYKVLQATTFGKLELRNRFVRSATGDSMADADGAVTDRSLQFFDELAAGGAGLIITAFSFVAASGQSAAGQYGIHSDEMLPGLSRLAEVCHARGAKVAIQLAHSGLRSGYLKSQGSVALAPSVIPQEGWPTAPAPPEHRAMTEEDIEGLIDDFVVAAMRARTAGFDAVQLHSAHGYLMSEFLSPIANRRKDRWGGSAENRRRFHIETIRRIRAAVGADYPIWMKIGIMDDSEGGLTLEEGIAALGAMAKAGLDGVEISGGVFAGGVAGRQGPVRAIVGELSEDIYYRGRAETAKRTTGVPIMLVGGVRSIETAEEIVESMDADLVSMCRPFIREPDLINRWLSGDYRPATCISCSKCIASMNAGRPLECVEERQSRDRNREEK